MKPLRHELAVVVAAGQRPAAIGPMIDRLERALAGISWEAVFFADDDDGTVEAVTRAAQGRENLRCLPGARDSGLAKLCAEGLLATSSSSIAVMDTDMRQDESLLPRMSLLLREARLDAVIGTCSEVLREEEPERRGWRNRRRIVGPQEAPPGEFFVMRREFLSQSLRNLASKTVRSFHDLLAAAPGEVRFQIMPFEAPRRRGRMRRRGARREFSLFYREHAIERFMPSRAARFGFIGAAGVAVHMSLVVLMHRFGGLEFASVQAGAAMSALMFTFLMCNMAAPEDRQLPGGAVMRGAFAFFVLCGFGLALNVFVADLVHQRGIMWGIAGLGGAAISWVWNFTVGAAFTWRPRDAGVVHGSRIPDGSGAHPGVPVGG